MEYNVWAQMEFAETYSFLRQYDSALYRYNLFDTTHAKEKDLRIFLVSKGEYFLMRKEYNKALQNFLRGLDLHKKLGDKNQIMRTTLDISKAYLALNEYSSALNFAYQGLQFAKETKARQFIRDGYLVLASVYDRLHKTDSAYSFHLQYIAMKDSVASDQIKARFAAYGYEQKLELLNKENQIHQARLEKESFQKKMLIVGIAFLFLLGSIIFWNIILKRRNEKQQLQLEIELQRMESEATKTKLQQQATELEMQSLRAQMNPHFIFNCLSSINRFILKNESDIASDYLTKFSRLIRMVLNNSRKSSVVLEDELEMLRLYLDLER
ncbi:histidine kinase, partial [bacterium]|nr:histidine kinase [bacterium]